MLECLLARILGRTWCRGNSLKGSGARVMDVELGMCRLDPLVERMDRKDGRQLLIKWASERGMVVPFLDLLCFCYSKKRLSWLCGQLCHCFAWAIEASWALADIVPVEKLLETLAKGQRGDQDVANYLASKPGGVSASALSRALRALGRRTVSKMAYPPEADMARYLRVVWKALGDLEHYVLSVDATRLGNVETLLGCIGGTAGDGSPLLAWCPPQTLLRVSIF